MPSPPASRRTSPCSTCTSATRARRCRSPTCRDERFLSLAQGRVNAEGARSELMSAHSAPPPRLCVEPFRLARSGSVLPGVGRAAFEEGAHALARLARLEALELRLGLVLEHPLQTLLLAHVYGALGRGNRGLRRR